MNNNDDTLPPLHTGFPSPLHSPTSPSAHLTASTLLPGDRGPCLPNQHQQQQSQHNQQATTMGPHERALLLWMQAPSLDVFYTDVYNYFYGRGAACISLNRLALLVRAGFSAALVLFLSSCVDYSVLDSVRAPAHIADVVRSDCPRLHPLVKVPVMAAALWWIWSVVELWRDQTMLRRMREFYEHVLEIPDEDIQSASWTLVLARLEQLAVHHPHPSLAPRSNASSSSAIPTTAPVVQPTTLSRVGIVSRILRRDNYLVALFSTPGVLDLSVPVPLLGGALSPLLTRLLQWNIELCVLGVLFSDARVWAAAVHHRSSATSAGAAGTGGMHPAAAAVHRKRMRRAAARRLRTAFVAAAIANALVAPLVAAGMLVYLVLRYGDEYSRNPAPLSARRFTPLAHWRTRELNEVPHEHELRLARAADPATRYLQSFPATKTAIAMRLVAYLLGALAGSLLAIAALYPDAVLHLHVGGSPLVVVAAALASALAVVRGLRGSDPRSYADPRAALPPVPPLQSPLGAASHEHDDGTTSSGPGALLHDVVAHTHYCPRAWVLAGFHSARVQAAVAAMFVPAAQLYALELAGVLVTPLVLGLSLARVSDGIVEFIMEHTAVVPGLGCVYDGALFDVRRVSSSSATAAATGAAVVVGRDGEVADDYDADSAGATSTSPAPPHSVAVGLTMGGGDHHYRSGYQALSDTDDDDDGDLDDEEVALGGDPEAIQLDLGGAGAAAKTRRGRRGRRAVWDTAALHKMTTSVLQFQSNHPTWRPEPETAVHVERITQAYYAEQQQASHVLPAVAVPAVAPPAASSSSSAFLRMTASASGAGMLAPRRPRPPYRSIYESVVLPPPPPPLPAMLAQHQQLQKPITVPPPQAPSSSQGSGQPTTQPLLDLGSPAAARQLLHPSSAATATPSVIMPAAAAAAPSPPPSSSVSSRQDSFPAVPSSSAATHLQRGGNGPSSGSVLLPDLAASPSSSSFAARPMAGGGAARPAPIAVGSRLPVTAAAAAVAGPSGTPQSLLSAQLMRSNSGSGSNSSVPATTAETVGVGARQQQQALAPPTTSAGGGGGQGGGAQSVTHEHLTRMVHQFYADEADAEDDDDDDGDGVGGGQL
ncbi:autophagy protein Apg9-domain-containing protein [Blastocladiella britannica]|nr:autophagy protein Apg9-domain-containing protein [Blastocladiella britannica]